MVEQRGEREVNDTELREIYQRLMARSASAGTDCPPPEAIQALARREGDESARLATLDHVMACRDCRGDLDLLRSIEDAGAALTRSEKPAHRRWLIPAALAASVLFAVVLGRAVLTPHTEDVLRAGPETAAVILVAPEHEIAAGAPVTFAWQPVAAANRYRLEVLTSGGDIAVEAETQDTTVTLGSVGDLTPGEYQWWVVAMTPRPGPRSALRPLRLVAR